jgi:glycosyltransferase involved in cell wall biosynthesis
MKLGILCTMINGFGRRGYYNSQEIGLAKALADLGHEVVVYKGVLDGEKEDTVSVYHDVKVQYMHMRHVGAHGIMRCSKMDKDIKGLLCFADEQLFLLHVYHFCQRNGIVFVPYIGIAHSVNNDLKGKISDWLFHRGTLRIYRKRPVICKTWQAMEELGKLGVQDMRIAPVGLDVTVLKKNFDGVDRNELRKQYGYGPDDIILLNISRLVPEKRILELITLLDEIKDRKNFKLLLIGKGELRRAIDDKIKKLHLTNIVQIIDQIPYEKMWEIYTISDYYLGMNTGEIFGMAIMEAVYYETSVASRNGQGPSLILKNMKGHKLCENDAEIKQWICGLYPSKEELVASSHKVIEEFSWKKCAETFTALVLTQQR